MTATEFDALDRWIWLVAELNGRGVVGAPGVRDPEHPCKQFDTGSTIASADCDGDGHYLCRECARKQAGGAS